MPNEHIAVAMARDSRLNERHKALFERAIMLACKERHVALRESGSDGSHVVFDCGRGEIRITVEIVLSTKGQASETLELKLREHGLLVFHVVGRRVKSERGRDHTAARVAVYVESYWEAIIRFIS